jgi:hypothetical protein
MDPPPLPPHLRQFGCVIYFFCCIAQLARTSRRQVDSGLVSPLEETQRRPPEQG